MASAWWVICKDNNYVDGPHASKQIADRIGWEKLKGHLYEVKLLPTSDKNAIGGVLRHMGLEQGKTLEEVSEPFRHTLPE